jgi:hypothetical protein
VYYVEWNKLNVLDNELNIIKTDILAIDNYVEVDSLQVGIVNIQDVAEKMIYYFNPVEKENDLLELKNYVNTNLSSRVIYEKFKNIIQNIHTPSRWK